MKEENASNESNDMLIWKRRKLRKREVEILEKEFEKNPNWTKKYIKSLAEQTGLPYYKIYKWNWDTKRKSSKDSEEIVSLGKRCL